MWFFLFFALLHLSLAADDFYLTLKHETNCKDWEGTSNLYIETEMFIGVNKSSGRIQEMLFSKRCFNTKMKPTTQYKYSSSKSPSEKLDWTYGLAVTWRDIDGSEVGDDDIAYGYDPKNMHNDAFKDGCKKLPRDKMGSLKTPFKEHPFRYRKLELTGKNGAKLVDLETDCNNENPRAWIAQPGIYRLVKESKADFYWENIYYWPRNGQMFT